MNMHNREPELTDGRVPLCDGRGRLNPQAVGWSRQPLHICEIPGRWPRKKKWNYWCVTTPEVLFSVTISTLDYATLGFIYFLDFGTKEFIEETVTIPFSGNVVMPPTVEGAISFKHPKMTIEFDAGPNETRIRARMESFGGKALEADFTIRRPDDHESLNVVIPWSERLFQFTSKQHCLPTEGSIRIGERTVMFDPATANGCLDFGRGVWPYRCTWNWGGGSGRSGDKTVGLNFGGQWTDGTGMTENGIIIDGRLTKIGDDVEFVYDTTDFMKPWRIKTKNSDQIDLEFVPFFDRVAAANMLVIKSCVHQLIGDYSGRVTTQEGERIEIDGLVGWAEEHIARW